MSNTINEADHAALTRQLMAELVIRDDASTTPQLLVGAKPIVTSKGRLVLVLQANAFLDIDQVTLLRNWLSDYIGHTSRPLTKL